MSGNTFFAIRPDARTGSVISRRIAATRRQYGLTGRPIPPERLHVSLHNGSRYCAQNPLTGFEQACAAASTIKFPPFAVTFDQALSFLHPSRRPYVLVGSSGIEALSEFYAQLGRLLTGQLGARLPEKFTPHLTLLYDATKHEIQPISWIVADFVLLRSQPGSEQYELLGCWPLR